MTTGVPGPFAATSEPAALVSTITPQPAMTAARTPWTTVATGCSSYRCARPASTSAGTPPTSSECAVPEWPWTAGAGNPGSSGIATAARSSPSAGTTSAHPEPSTTAARCSPRRSRIADAAAWASEYGSPGTPGLSQPGSRRGLRATWPVPRVPIGQRGICQLALGRSAKWHGVTPRTSGGRRRPCARRSLPAHARAGHQRARGGDGQSTARRPAGDGDVRARRQHIADERLDLRGGRRPRHDRQRRPVRDRARGAGVRRVHPDRQQGRRSHRAQAGLRAGPARLRRRRTGDGAGPEPDGGHHLLGAGGRARRVAPAARHAVAHPRQLRGSGPEEGLRHWSGPRPRSPPPSDRCSEASSPPTCPGASGSCSRS